MLSTSKALSTVVRKVLDSVGKYVPPHDTVFGYCDTVPPPMLLRFSINHIGQTSAYGPEG